MGSFFHYGEPFFDVKAEVYYGVFPDTEALITKMACREKRKNIFEQKQKNGR